MPSKKLAVLSTLLIVVGLVMMSISSAAFATPAANGKDRQPKNDDLMHPLKTQQRELREKGLEAKLNGKAYGKTYEVARGQYVELAREGEGAIWTVLGEFGPLDHPAPILFSGVPGPLRNQIPQPDRSVDNTTIWAPDFTEAYYENLLFSEAPGAVSMRKDSLSTYRAKRDFQATPEPPGEAPGDADGTPAIGEFVPLRLDAA